MSIILKIIGRVSLNFNESVAISTKYVLEAVFTDFHFDKKVDIQLSLTFEGFSHRSDRNGRERRTLHVSSFNFDFCAENIEKDSISSPRIISKRLSFQWEEDWCREGEREFL